MSVYTELTFDEVAAILADYRLGELRDYRGIAAGIENSNFFIDTASGRFVLTLFERLGDEELPYFMHLMHHLAAKGSRSPDVMQRRDGALLFFAHGKLGCIVSCLSGSTQEALNLTQLASAGRALAELHLAGADFPLRRANPTGVAWLRERIEPMLPDVALCYGAEVSAQLREELLFQLAADSVELPGGVIHADYFCDNILFTGDEVSGVIDFYYAHDNSYAYDLAVALNALALLPGEEDVALLQQRMHALVSGYETVRPLTGVERAALPAQLRLGALRFWTSRLYDALYPRAGAVTQIKDPEEYRSKLLLHRQGTIGL